MFESDIRIRIESNIPNIWEILLIDYCSRLQL